MMSLCYSYWSDLEILSGKYNDLISQNEKIKKELVMEKERVVHVRKGESVVDLLASHIKELKPSLDPNIRILIAKSVEKWCNEYGLSYSLVINLIYAETYPKFNILSKSNKDCIGLMQVNYKVWRKEIEELKDMEVSDLYHIDTNIKIGCIILKKYIDSSNTLSEALEKYVGGSNRKYINQIYEKMALWEVNKSSLNYMEDIGGEKGKE